MTVEIFILGIVGVMLLLLGVGVTYVNIRNLLVARENKKRNS